MQHLSKLIFGKHFLYAWIHEWFYEYSPPIFARKYPRPYHSIGRHYIGMARAAPPMQDTFNAFKLTN